MVASMVIIGGITRITNSGLSMTEWNLIGGIVPPLNLQDWNTLFSKYKATPEYEFKNFDITLSEFQFIFFWEYFHRVWGRLIGFTFLIPLIYFWLSKKLSGSEKKFVISTLLYKFRFKITLYFIIFLANTWTNCCNNIFRLATPFF